MENQIIYLPKLRNKKAQLCAAVIGVLQGAVPVWPANLLWGLTLLLWMCAKQWVSAWLSLEQKKCLCLGPSPQTCQLTCLKRGIGMFPDCPGNSRVRPGLTSADVRRYSSTAFILHPSLSHIYLWPAFFLSTQRWPDSFAYPWLLFLTKWFF